MLISIYIYVCVRDSASARRPYTRRARRECWLLLRPRSNPRSTSFPAAYYYPLATPAFYFLLYSPPPSLPSRNPIPLPFRSFLPSNPPFVSLLNTTEAHIRPFTWAVGISLRTPGVIIRNT